MKLLFLLAISASLSSAFAQGIPKKAGKSELFCPGANKNNLPKVRHERQPDGTIKSDIALPSCVERID